MSVRVRVRLFAGLRERAGYAARELELPDGATVADVWPALQLGEEPSGLARAVNRTYHDASTPLADGDEVALIPPVSGGDAAATERPAVSIGAKPLDLAALVAAVSTPAAGAIATFIGTARDHARGRGVIELEYEAYEEMALQEMARIAEHVLREHGCLRAAVWHRTGRVAIGEASVAIAVSAAHRAAALDACHEAIDTLKETVPIWKKERYVGGEEWIGRGA